jgi:HAD superfamily hydrolase (TIGR01662 family)
MLEGVVFDLGGTLLQFEGDWVEVFRRSRKALIASLHGNGVAVSPERFSEAVRERIEQTQWEREQDHRERPALEIVSELLEEFGHKGVKRETVMEAVADMFAVSEAHWQAEPELHEVLGEVRDAGYRLGLVSNASDERNVHRLLAKAEILDYFDPIIVSASVGVRKPASGIFKPLLDRWQMQPAKAIMIGDTLDADILGAQQVGMKDMWLRTHEDRPDNRIAASSVVPQFEVEDLASVPAALARIATGQATV